MSRRRDKEEGGRRKRPRGKEKRERTDEPKRKRGGGCAEQKEDQWGEVRIYLCWYVRGTRAIRNTPKYSTIRRDGQIGIGGGKIGPTGAGGSTINKAGGDSTCKQHGWCCCPYSICTCVMRLVSQPLNRDWPVPIPSCLVLFRQPHLFSRPI
jgi:hypothetical protein